jgi:hypothetical protein
MKRCFCEETLGFRGPRVSGTDRRPAVGGTRLGNLEAGNAVDGGQVNGHFWFEWLTMNMSDTWSSSALRSCLDHLGTSRVTEAQLVAVERSWTDGPDAFCVVYRPPYDGQRRVGLRRSRSDCAEASSYRLGDFVSGRDLGDPLDPDPVAFGRDVADFDLGEPMGAVVNILRIDSDGIGWWGTLDEQLPTDPP